MRTFFFLWICTGFSKLRWRLGSWMLTPGSTDSLSSVQGHILQLDFPGSELETAAHKHPACVRIRSAVVLDSSCPIQRSSCGRSTTAVSWFVYPSENWEPAGRCHGRAGAGSGYWWCLVLHSPPQSLLLPWVFIQLQLSSTGVAPTDCQRTRILSEIRRVTALHMTTMGPPLHLPHQPLQGWKLLHPTRSGVLQPGGTRELALLQSALLL